MSEADDKTYSDAILFMSLETVVCEESIDLIAHLWHRNASDVRCDIEALRQPIMKKESER